jgi:hypothetical protein
MTTAASITTVPLGRPAWSRSARIGYYDGALDKEDTKTERVPRAFVWYNEFTGALGTAFGDAGFVHARKLALARLNAAIQRGAEKIDANSHPDTCDDFLGEWVKILGVRLNGDETRQEIRERCAAKFTATRGATRANIDDVCARLLGPFFQGNFCQKGVDLATPPDPTAWPGVNAGDPSYSLGGGAWYSVRSHLAVSVTTPQDINDLTWIQLVREDLPPELDRDLPAWMTFNVASDLGSGFLLDISRLDFGGLT